MALDVKEIFPWGILGCGWLGQGLCADLTQDHIPVWGSARTEKTKAAIAASGGTPISFDTALPILEQSTWPKSKTLLVSWPPSAGATAYQHAVNCAKTHAEWTILISSTSVYPGEAGTYSENDAVRRVSPHSGECLLDIEGLFDPTRTTILRAGGLFGPHRNPKHFLRGRAPERLTEAVNMVHLDDVVRAIRFSAEHRIPGAFNVVAPKTVTREVFYHAAGALPELKHSQVEPEGRRVSSQKITDSGFSFQHPDPAHACREMQRDLPPT